MRVEKTNGSSRYESLPSSLFSWKKRSLCVIMSCTRRESTIRSSGLMICALICEDVRGSRAELGDTRVAVVWWETTKTYRFEIRRQDAHQEGCELGADGRGTVEAPDDRWDGERERVENFGIGRPRLESLHDESRSGDVREAEGGSSGPRSLAWGTQSAKHDVVESQYPRACQTTGEDAAYRS